MKHLIIGDPGGHHSLYLIEQGVNPADITVWENDSSHIALVQAINNNISITTDLSLLSDMQFDIIIGNPPYQGGDTDHAVYQSIWTLFWRDAFRLVKPGGRISLITPLTWCAPTSDFAKKDAVEGHTRLWDVFQKYSTVADVTNIAQHFPGVGSTFSMVTVDTSGSDGLVFSDGYRPRFHFYPLSGRDRVDSELSTTDNLASRCEFSGKAKSGWRVSLLKSRKINETNVEVCANGQDPTTGANPTLYTHIMCDSKEQAEHVRQRILDCEDILYRHCRYNGFIDINILGMLKYQHEV